MKEGSEPALPGEDVLYCCERRRGGLYIAKCSVLVVVLPLGKLRHVRALHHQPEQLELVDPRDIVASLIVYDEDL